MLQGGQANPYAIEARIYLGIVDYDGQTQAEVSAKTDTDYFGISAETVGGLRLAGSLRMDLLGDLVEQEIKNTETKFVVDSLLKRHSDDFTFPQA